MKRTLFQTVILFSAFFWTGVPAGAWVAPYPPGEITGSTAYHHYVYDGCVYIPQYYRYDPYPNYRAFTYNHPPFYTGCDLSYYEGFDRGRPERFRRQYRWFHH